MIDNELMQRMAASLTAADEAIAAATRTALAEIRSAARDLVMAANQAPVQQALSYGRETIYEAPAGSATTIFRTDMPPENPVQQAPVQQALPGIPPITSAQFMQTILERNRADGGKTGNALREIMAHQGITDLGALKPEQYAWILQALGSLTAAMGGAA